MTVDTVTDPLLRAWSIVHNKHWLWNMLNCHCNITCNALLKSGKSSSNWNETHCRSEKKTPQRKIILSIVCHFQTYRLEIRISAHTPFTNQNIVRKRSTASVHHYLESEAFNSHGVEFTKITYLHFYSSYYWFRTENLHRDRRLSCLHTSFWYFFQNFVVSVQTIVHLTRYTSCFTVSIQYHFILHMKVLLIGLNIELILINKWTVTVH